MLYMRDDELLEWAMSKGYRHYRCSLCGWSGWVDGNPRDECDCPPEEEESHAEYAQCAISGEHTTQSRIETEAPKWVCRCGGSHLTPLGCSGARGGTPYAR